VGPENLRPHWLALLAEAYGEAWQPEAGLTVLDEAFTRVVTMGARWWEAELSRLMGVLRLQLPSPEVSRAETYSSRPSRSPAAIRRKRWNCGLP
jgi:hypothetical protein